MTHSYNVRPPVKEKDCTFLNLPSEKRGTRQKYIYFKHTEIYTWKKARVKFVRNIQQTNQKSERLWKYIVRPIRDTNDSTSQWRATSARLSVKTKWKQRCQDLFSLKDNRWPHRWARKQKHECKDWQKRKPANNLPSKGGRAQKRWRNTSCSTQWIAERVRTHCQSDSESLSSLVLNQRWHSFRAHITAR